MQRIMKNFKNTGQRQLRKISKFIIYKDLCDSHRSFSCAIKYNNHSVGLSMSIIITISSFIIPAIMLFIVFYGIIRKQNVYDDFVKGATGGFTTVIKVMPTLIGLMVAVGVLRESGFMEFIGTWMGRITNKVGFPGELMPVTIVKIFSSSAATGMVMDIFKEYGPDSYLGKVTSIMMSSTETVFYTMSVYFLTAKVTKTRWTLAGALLSTFAGTIASVILAGLL